MRLTARRPPFDDMLLSRQIRLSEVNAVLRTLMDPDSKRAVQLAVKPNNRLVLRYEQTTGFDIDASIRSDGLWLAKPRKCRPFGGTEEQAIVQLIRWHRDMSRKSLDWWKYWATQGLGRPEMYATISDSSYNDKSKFACVLCGKPGARDWWARDGVSGPACRHAFDGVCPK